MRCLILSSEFPPGPGGIGTHAWELGRQLQRRGWQPAVMTPGDYATLGQIARFDAAAPFPVYRLRPLRPALLEGLYRALRLRRVLRPDLLIATGQRSLWLAAFGARRDLPWVGIGHGSEFGRPRGLAARLTRAAIRRARRLVCVSEFTRELAVAMGIARERATVIPNGADGEFFQPLREAEVAAARRRLGLEGQRTVLTVGRVSERKGQEVVARALAELPGAFDDVVYLVAGLADRAEPLRRAAREAGVADRVRLLGAVDREEIRRLYAACDLFAMTSRRTADGDVEGYGIAVVEAALMGRPALVSASGGLPEAVVDGETGRVVSEGSVTETATGLAELLADHDLRARLGRAAHRRAAAEQTWERRGAQYDEVLRDALDASPVP